MEVVGLRVVRGLDWKWGNQDGGEGSVGTVVVVGRAGSTSSPEKTVIVQWDGGTRTNYRCGHENAYDLYVLDNGPIGQVHNNVSCSECRKQGVEGMLWLCAQCQGHTLCTACYTNDKHPLEHSFYRRDSPLSTPVLVNKRQGQQKCSAVGTFLNAQVIRGPDWDWGNQDGGSTFTKKGIVKNIRNWENETYGSVVTVIWPGDECNVYRRGHKGKVDVICTAPSFGGFYYKNHLPKLGYNYSSTPTPTATPKPPTPVPPLPRQNSQETYQFQVGDQVQILLEPEVLKLLQKGFGGWNERMKEVIRMPGTVQRVLDSDGVKVQFIGSSNTNTWTFNPIALSRVPVDGFKVHDSVCLLSDASLVKSLQVSHGEWSDKMTTILGKEGKVLKVYSDGDIRVVVGNTAWTVNPDVLRKTSGPTAVTAENTPEQKQAQTASTAASFRDTEETSLPSLLEIISLSSSEIPAQLISAAGLGQYIRVRDILDANPSQVNSNKKGKTALHVASHQGHVDVVKLLLKSGSNHDLQDNDGDTPLHYAAFGNKPLVASVLVQHGANTNTLNTNKCTPLHVAVSKGHTDVVRVLVKANCDVNMQDSSGDTALHDAITKDLPDIINIIINSNTCELTLVNQQGFNAFHRAALKGREHALSLILSKCPVMLNTPKDDGYTALHLSSLNGHISPIRTLLLQRDCEVNRVNDNHQTALLLAVDKKHMDVIRELLQHDANTNIQDDVGDTPLHTAVANQQPHSDTITLDMVRLLLQHGADTTIQNEHNETCLDLCRDTETADLLRTATSTHQVATVPEPVVSDTDNQCASLPQTNSEPAVSTITTSACRLCNEVVDCQFHPCGHSVVCFGCSHMFKACFQCKAEVKNVIHIEQASKKECIVCSDLSAEVVFEPCLHQVACTECSIRMKKCILCQQKIIKKIGPDGAVIETIQAGKYGRNMDSLVYLEARVREMEDSHTCAICMENTRNVAFLCGHTTCEKCCKLLKDCPMCRKPIEKKIPLFE